MFSCCWFYVSSERPTPTDIVDLIRFSSNFTVLYSFRNSDEEKIIKIVQNFIALEASFPTAPVHASYNFIYIYDRFPTTKPMFFFSIFFTVW